MQLWGRVGGLFLAMRLRASVSPVDFNNSEIYRELYQLGLLLTESSTVATACRNFGHVGKEAIGARVWQVQFEGACRSSQARF